MSLPLESFGGRKDRGVNTWRLKRVPCPNCQMSLDAASARGPDGPKAGDLTVCIYCDAVLMFVLGDKFYLMTQQDIEALEPNERKAVEGALRVVAGARALLGREKLGRE